MSEKSYVSMEQKLCEVCAKPYDSGAILLDKRLKDSMEQHTITGIEGKCPECQKKFDEGYIALVEIDPIKSNIAGRQRINQEDVYRTGTLVHLKENVFNKVFNGAEHRNGICFIDHEVTEKLQSMVQQ